jgi:hypothetical protein
MIKANHTVAAFIETGSAGVTPVVGFSVAG